MMHLLAIRITTLSVFPHSFLCLLNLNTTVKTGCNSNFASSILVFIGLRNFILMIVAVYDHNLRISRLLNYIKQKALFVLVLSVLLLFGCLALGLLGGGGGRLRLNRVLAVLNLLIFNVDQHLVCLSVCECFYLLASE